MSALAIRIDDDYLTSRGPWHFTRQAVVADHMIDDFYTLYSLAFAPLKKHAVARQVLTESEFRGQMSDRRVDKYVAWDEAGDPVGLTTLTRDLTSVPWISPEFFADRYPAQWARNAVYYLGFIIAHPSQRHQRFVETLVRVGMEQAITEHAVIAYDMCAYNNEVVRFDERLAALLAGVPGARVERLDAQFYSCMAWS